MRERWNKIWEGPGMDESLYIHIRDYCRRLIVQLRGNVGILGLCMLATCSPLRLIVNIMLM